MEIVQERLEREFNMTVINTVPNVSYIAHVKDGESPIPTILLIFLKVTTKLVEEPYIKARTITKSDYIGPVRVFALKSRRAN